MKMLNAEFKIIIVINIVCFEIIFTLIILSALPFPLSLSALCQNTFISLENKVAVLW
jgi:hypothetical protein